MIQLCTCECDLRTARVMTLIWPGMVDYSYSYGYRYRGRRPDIRIMITAPELSNSLNSSSNRCPAQHAFSDPDTVLLH